MQNDAEPAGTHEPELALIPADSALYITLISASLIPLRGFGLPRLSNGVVSRGLSRTDRRLSLRTRHIDNRHRRRSAAPAAPTGWVRYDGRTRTMFAYDGVDVWFCGAGPLPSPGQVTHGLQAAFAAQMEVYRADGALTTVLVRGYRHRPPSGKAVRIRSWTIGSRSVAPSLLSTARRTPSSGNQALIVR